ncbi:UPF0001 protein YggS [hydrothermal vent metagenome]|uniref:UPF0001 protein YggS n=1 Tax=hydrothermal vent metagenome TaxID=652676 RepID=A0A3B0RJA2_9ZZZZ
MSDICERRKQITEKIKIAAKQAGRAPAAVLLVAVSKRQTQARITAAWDAGQRVFGENQLQEAQAHWAQRRKQNQPFQLHMIGHLQSNKAKAAVELFDVIETVSSIKLAKALDKAMLATQRRPQIYIQVNTGEEPQKQGVVANELPALLQQIRDETTLVVTGLMCIPPQNQEPGLHFALLAKLAKRHQLPDLSMGMSEDFETAVRFGASSVRVGSGLFGPREN